jgi:RNA polymerase sigma-70 factor (ECF subfamily)
VTDQSPFDATSQAREDHDKTVAGLRQALERVVWRTCPPWLANHRDDLVQTALLKVIEARKKRNEGIDEVPASYLYRVAHSALVDEIRRHRRQREVALEEGGGTVEQSERVHDPAREPPSLQTGQAIQDCLSQMKTERQRATTLYLQGSSVPDSSRILGWNRKRTENLVFRGLMDLRQCLLKKGIRP